MWSILLQSNPTETFRHRSNECRSKTESKKTLLNQTATYNNTSSQVMEVILSAGVQSEEAFLHPQTQLHLQTLEKGKKETFFSSEITCLHFSLYRIEWRWSAWEVESAAAGGSFAQHSCWKAALCVSLHSFSAENSLRSSKQSLRRNDRHW